MISSRLTLNNGDKMPRLGLGTWKAPPEKTKAAIITAVEAGYRSPLLCCIVLHCCLLCTG